MRRSRRTLGLIAALAAGLLVAPLAAAAQAGRIYRIGLIGTTSPAAAQHLVEAFRSGMREHGWIESRNFAVEYRWAEGRMDRLADFAAEFVRLNVDVIFAAANPAIAAVKQATTTIPIVMIGSNPVGSGFVQSLARPGGNITGLSRDVTPETFAKNLQLLKEFVPSASRVAVVWDPAFPGGAAYWKATENVAGKLGVTLQSADVRRPDEIETAFAAIVRERAGGLLVFSTPVTFAARSQIAALAAKHRLPAIYDFREYADAGGLLSYGVSFPDLTRRAALYVVRIFKGAKPAELPVEQPTRFELIINLRTAKAFGLTIPPSLLLRADELIQ